MTRIYYILVLNRPALAPRETLPFFDVLVGFYMATALCPFRIDHIDFVADVDTVRDGLFVGVFADDVFLEESVRTVVRRSGEANEK